MQLVVRWLFFVSCCEWMYIHGNKTWRVEDKTYKAFGKLWSLSRLNFRGMLDVAHDGWFFIASATVSWYDELVVGRNPIAVTKDVAKLRKALITAQEDNRVLKLCKTWFLWDEVFDMCWIDLDSEFGRLWRDTMFMQGS